MLLALTKFHIISMWYKLTLYVSRDKEKRMNGISQAAIQAVLQALLSSFSFSLTLIGLVGLDARGKKSATKTAEQRKRHLRHRTVN